MSDVLVDEDYLWALETLAEGTAAGRATRDEYKRARNVVKSQDAYIMRDDSL